MRSYEVGLNLACCMRRSSEMSELPDLRKSSYVKISPPERMLLLGELDLASEYLTVGSCDIDATRSLKK